MRWECRSTWLLLQVGRVCVHRCPTKQVVSQATQHMGATAHTYNTGHTCMHTQCTGHGPQQGLKGMAPVVAHLQEQRGLSWSGGLNGRDGVSVRLVNIVVATQHNRGAGAPLAQGGAAGRSWLAVHGSPMHVACVSCVERVSNKAQPAICQLAGPCRKGVCVVTSLPCAILPQPQLFQLIPRQPRKE